MLKYLEDREHKDGKKVIIGFGHSIGGGVQGDAIDNYTFRDDVQYLFIKSRTFIDLSTTVSEMFARPLGFLVWLIGWNLSCNSSRKPLYGTKK
jgi:hypothetical protein